MEYSYTHGQPLQQGEDIRAIQSKLNTIRETWNGSWSYLTTDGIYGRNTRDAVKAFQIFANITPVTGNLDSATQIAINDKFEESKLAYSPCPVSYGRIQLAAANYTQGGMYLLDSTDIVDEVWDSNKTELEAISKDIIDIVMAVVDDKTQKSLNSKLMLHQSRMSAAWKNYTSIMEKIKPQPMPNYRNLEAIYEASNSPIDVKRGQLFRRRRELNGKSLAQILRNQADKMFKAAQNSQQEIRTITKNAVGSQALSKLGYGISVFDVLYHGSKWFFAEGELDNKKYKEEFKKSVDDALSTISFGAFTDVAIGVTTKAATGAAGGPYGIAITTVVAVLDVVLVSTTGKSLSDRMMQHLRTMDDLIFPKVTTEQISNGMYLPIGNGYYVPGIT